MTDRRFFDETVNGETADRAESLRIWSCSGWTPALPLKGLDPAEKDDAQAVVRRVVGDDRPDARGREADAQDIVVRSQELGNAEQSQALLVATAVGALLLIVLLITTGVVRSLVRPLRQLRREALEVAGERLPAYVRAGRESRDGEITAEVPSIGITSHDEIGEVARAFDEVHREAVRLAGDEARLRDTVNAMFVNLSRAGERAGNRGVCRGDRR